MSELQGASTQEPSEQQIRDAYLQVLGFPPEAESGGTMACVSTAELSEMAYAMRARELGAPLLPTTKDL